VTTILSHDTNVCDVQLQVQLLLQRLQRRRRLQTWWLQKRYKVGYF